MPTFHRFLRKFSHQFAFCSLMLGPHRVTIWRVSAPVFVHSHHSGRYCGLRRGRYGGLATMPPTRKPPKEVKPAPPCQCECWACDKGIHCGTRSRAANTRPTKLRGEHIRGVCAPNRRCLAPLFLLYPLNEQRLKFLLRVNSFMNQQRVHRINRSFEPVISRGPRQCVFKRHILIILHRG